MIGTNTLTVEKPPRAKRSKRPITNSAEALSQLIQQATLNSGLAKYETPLRWVMFQPGSKLPDGRITEKQVARLQYGSKVQGVNNEIFFEWKFVPTISQDQL